MKFRLPNAEELDELVSILTLTDQEMDYWIELKKDCDSQTSDYSGMIRFYVDEFEKTDRPSSTGLDRRFKAALGYLCEWCGKDELTDTKQRIDMFETAIQWYQAADEVAGFLTDYALRQAVSCGLIARYRLEAGLADPLTMYYAHRRVSLLKGFIGSSDLEDIIDPKDLN